MLEQTAGARATPPHAGSAADAGTQVSTDAAVGSGDAHVEMNQPDASADAGVDASNGDASATDAGGPAGAGGAAESGSGGTSDAAGSGGEGSTPALKYDCPMGDADADGNGYPDACEQMLWKVYTPPGTDWLTYGGSTYDWDPSTLAGITLSQADDSVGDDDVHAGTYDSSKPAKDRFAGVNDVHIYDATVDVEARRLAADLFSSTGNGTDLVYVTPESSVDFGTQAAMHTGLAARHIVYFKRTITGYGYDAATHVVALRGGWQIYGY